LRRALDRIGSGERDVQLATAAIEEVAAVERGFNGMAAALRDADAHNRRLTRELLRVQEEERRAIARELHDEFAQQATAIDAEAAVLASILRDDAAGLASVASIRDGARGLLRMTRGRLEALRPEVLDDFGVVAAIEELCDSFQGSHQDIALTRSLPRELPLNDEQSIAVFRVLQESLTNIARHARARQVDVALRHAHGAGGSIIELTVSDDGVGLPGGRASRAGFGLLGMRERIESLGGRLMLRPTAAGGGLAVVAALPLAGFG
jgi:two-component system sensor histidine kinase UhpB